MSFDINRFENLQYLIHYPKSYQKGKSHPVIFFFHGSGTRGTDPYALARNDYFTVTAQYEDYPFVTIAPLCHEETWFDLFETLKRFVTELSGLDFCDPKRIYAIGASMGGYAVWQLAMSMPGYFSAIVPICGGGMYWNATRLKNLPIWAFHGEEDTIVYPYESRKMVDAVNTCGGNAKLTLYPECRHEAWVEAYSDPKLFEWLLSNHK